MLLGTIQLSDFWAFSPRHRERELAPTEKILKQKIEIMGELNASECCLTKDMYVDKIT